ncbi:MAG: hypothetical protein ACR2N3_09000 [Pyrinomonadaceae bacterium]
MKDNENITQEHSGLSSRSMTCSADAADNNAERITPELREYLEIELAKRIAAKALIDLQIQMLEVALSLAPK